MAIEAFCGPLGTYSGINVEDADSLFDRKVVEKRMNS